MKNKKKPFFGAGRQKLIPTAGREEREDSFQFENQFNLNNFFPVSPKCSTSQSRLWSLEFYGILSLDRVCLVYVGMYSRHVTRYLIYVSR